MGRDAASLGQWKADLETRSIQARGVGIPEHPSLPEGDRGLQGQKVGTWHTHQFVEKNSKEGFPSFVTKKLLVWLGKALERAQTITLQKVKAKERKASNWPLKKKEKRKVKKEKKKKKGEDEHKVTEALKKVRKRRDQTMSILSNLEEALKKAAPQLSTKGKGGALATQLKLEKQLTHTALLLKQSHDFKDLKKFLDDSAKALKVPKMTSRS